MNNSTIVEKTSSDEPESNVVVIDNDNDSSESYPDNHWVMIDNKFLYNTDKEVLTSKIMWLNDIICTDPTETPISSVWWIKVYSPTANQIPQITTGRVSTDLTHMWQSLDSCVHSELLYRGHNCL